MRPAKGSASVLNTKMDSGSASLDLPLHRAALAAGLAVAAGRAARRRVRETLHQQIEDARRCRYCAAPS